MKKEIEYMLIRTKTGRILFELRVPRVSLWKRAIAHIRFHKDKYDRWEANDAFKRFRNSNQYRPIRELIDTYRISNSDRGWRESHFSDKESISFVHELDNTKISF